jgi:hypothetical protein
MKKKRPREIPIQMPRCELALVGTWAIGEVVKLLASVGVVGFGFVEFEIVEIS